VVTQRKGYSFGTAGKLAFSMALFGLGLYLSFFLAHGGPSPKNGQKRKTYHSGVLTFHFFP